MRRIRLLGWLGLLISLATMLVAATMLQGEIAVLTGLAGFLLMFVELRISVALIYRFGSCDHCGGQVAGLERTHLAKTPYKLVVPERCPHCHASIDTRPGDPPIRSPIILP